MLNLAKIIQVVSGFFAIILLLSSIGSESNSTKEYSAIFSIIFAAVVYYLQKYIVKNSNYIELKNYRLRIWQVIISIYGLSQFLNFTRVVNLEQNIINIAMFLASAIVAILIEKKIAKNKSNDAT